MAFPDTLTILDLETILQCPVCYELPPSPILLCTRGHHVCEKCSKQLTNCPVCTASLTKTRNFLAEELIQKTEFLLKNKELGEEENKMCYKARKLSTNRNTLPALPLHEGLYNCPLEGCKNMNQSFGLGCILPHLRRFHTHLYSHFQNKDATFSTTFTLSYKRKRHYQKAIHISNMGLFFVTISTLGDHNINCFLRLAAPEVVANRFEYELEVSNPRQSFSHIDQVPPLEKQASWLVHRGRALIIRANQHSLFAGFDVKVTIVFLKKKPKIKKKKINEINS